MSICDIAAVNVDWQFSVSAGEGNIKMESPLSATSFLVSFSHWDPARDVVLPIGMSDEDFEFGFLFQLKMGQRHNPDAMASYDNCRKTFQSFWEFPITIFKAAPGRASNFGEVAAHIRWQIGANPDSVTNSRAAVEMSRRVQNPDSIRYWEVMAMHHLLTGQRHSAMVMQLYRACFRDDKKQLFSQYAHFEIVSPVETLAEFLSSNPLEKYQETGKPRGV